MPCEIAYFVDNEKYDMTLFFINFYICLIIIITTLIFTNTAYNYYVYNNIVLDKVDNDTIVIENGAYPLKGSQLSTENKILIGETVDYKLFISLLLDQNMYYNDKYFTLNITNILLDVFMLVTIVLVFFSIIYGCINSVPKFAQVIRLKLEPSELEEYIKQYCYFINNSSCDGYHTPKKILVALVLVILIVIYGLRRTIIPSIYYPDYLDFNKSINESKYGKKNIENMLNIICDIDDDFLNNDEDNNITKIIKKLNGHNIHTVDIIHSGGYVVNKDGLDTAKNALKALKASKLNAADVAKKNKTAANDKIYQDAKVAHDDLAINVFITKIKIISNIIKDNKDNKDNKDLDFVKLVIVYLNNKKIYNDNSRKEKITEMGRTYAQSLLNIITNVIPYSDNLFRKFKTENYDIENILIGAIPLSDRGNINDSTETCIIEYKDIDDFNAINEKPECYYTNYLFKLKETSTKLKTALIVILILSIISIIAILVLFYYIYINYNVDNMKWANMTAIKMRRLSWYNPLTLFGHIMSQLNNFK